MKAVFLDRNTFSASTILNPPEGITDWQVYDSTPQDKNVILERLQDADIVITNKVKLTPEILSALPKLKLIQITATGLNNVDLDYCKNNNLPVFNVAGYSTESVVEHTFMLILAAMRALLPYHQAVNNGAWQEAGRFCLVDIPLLDLHGKNLVIVGGGNIGRGIAKVAQAFGMNICFAERLNQSPRNENYREFKSAFAEADIISLHCPLTPETENLIRAETLAFCQKQPLIVNAARGPVVDSKAIYEALNSGKIKGYATDVFVDEPPREEEYLLKLAGHPRVIFTPHNAWASEYAQNKLWSILRQQITDFINK